MNTLIDLLGFYVLLTVLQFAYTVHRDMVHMKMTEEHSQKLVAAQQSVSQENLQVVYSQGFAAGRQANK